MLKCNCGAVIHDNLDSNSDKAHFVPDMQWFEFLDTLSSCGVLPAQFQGKSRTNSWHHVSFREGQPCRTASE